MKTTLRVASALACAVLLGCPSSSGDTTVAHRTIGPAGGTISSNDSVLTIAIPPGALDEEIEFFVQQTSEPPSSFGQAYLAQPAVELKFDATITYRGDLPSDPSRASIGAIDPIAYEEGGGNWMPLPVLRIDAEQGIVTGSDTQLSVFYTLLRGASSSTSGSNDDGNNDDADDGGTGGDSGLPGTDDGTTAEPPATTTGDEATAGDETTMGSSGEPAVSFAREVQPILTANCNCHIRDMPMGLSMVDGYGNLVDVASAEVPELDRIEPGVLEDSYLWHKINNTHLDVGGEGNPMPAPDGGLDAASIATIEQWILDGAAP